MHNELTVDPNYVDDLILIGEVRRALNKSALDSKRIGVRVTDGVVELTGITGSNVSKEDATQVALSVPGVVAVYNSLDVRAPTGSLF